MNCRDAAPLLHAYLDRELAPGAVSALEVHLAGCADCSTRLAGLEALSAALRRELPRYPAPPGLRARFEGTRNFGPDTMAGARARPPWTIAAGVLLSAVLGAAGMYGIDHARTARGTADTVFPSLIASHLRALAGPSPVDVVSTDRHTVKPWFAGRVDQSPPVIDLSEDGFPLIGGRVDYIGERRLPVVVYRRAQHIIDVYWFTDAPPAADTHALERHGYHLIQGTHDDQRAWIVSDLEPTELARFAKLLATPAPAAR